MLSPLHSSQFLNAIGAVGIITRVISVATDIAVLAFTLQKTAYIFKLNQELKALSKLTVSLAYNGTMTLMTSFYNVIVDMTNTHVGCFQFGWVLRSA